MTTTEKEAAEKIIYETPESSQLLHAVKQVLMTTRSLFEVRDGSYDIFQSFEKQLDICFFLKFHIKKSR